MDVLDYLYKKAEVLKVEYTETDVKVWVKTNTSYLPYLEKKNVVINEI